MKYFHCLAFLFVLSCVEDSGVHQADQSISQNYIEICHNPESTNHRKICTEKCFEPNLGSHSFCWTLPEQDCQEPLIYEWQRENCHLFD